MASSPAAGSRQTASVGWPAGRASSCRCACSRACSDAASSNSSPRRITLGSCTSSLRMPLSPQAARFSDWLAPLRTQEWVVYAKRPFAGPATVLAYLSRYTHRVAISNRRLVAFDERGVSFRWKDYRAKSKARYKTMTLSAEEFMRRFLLHVLPGGFHRIRHYGLLANAARRNNLARARELLLVAPEAAEPQPSGEPTAIVQPVFVCRHCGAPMLIIETFARASDSVGPQPDVECLRCRFEGLQRKR